MGRPDTALVQFGFTALEAEVYAQLLAHSPATGYRVSQAITKPAANVYKALESLERKGAAVLVTGSSREYSPVAPDELLATLSKEFEAGRRRALAALRSIKPASTGGAPSSVVLSSPEQVLAAAIAVIESAKTSLVVLTGSDFAAPLNAAARAVPAKVEFWIMAPGPPIANATESIVTAADAVEPGVLQVVADRSQAVFACGGQGIRASEPGLASAMHQAVVCQIGLYQVVQKLDEDASKKQIARVVESLP